MLPALCESGIILRMTTLPPCSHIDSHHLGSSKPPRGVHAASRYRAAVITSLPVPECPAQKLECYQVNRQKISHSFDHEFSMCACRWAYTRMRLRGPANSCSPRVAISLSSAPLPPPHTFPTPYMSLRSHLPPNPYANRPPVNPYALPPTSPISPLVPLEWSWDHVLANIQQDIRRLVESLIAHATEWLVFLDTHPDVRSASFATKVVKRELLYMQRLQHFAHDDHWFAPPIGQQWSDTGRIPASDANATHRPEYRRAPHFFSAPSQFNYINYYGKVTMRFMGECELTVLTLNILRLDIYPASSLHDAIALSNRLSTLTSCLESWDVDWGCFVHDVRQAPPLGHRIVLTTSVIYYSSPPATFSQRNKTCSAVTGMSTTLHFEQTQLTPRIARSQAPSALSLSPVSFLIHPTQAKEPTYQMLSQSVEKSFRKQIHPILYQTRGYKALFRSLPPWTPPHPPSL